MTKIYRVQGSSSVYEVRENAGKMVCYTDKGALCPAWRNSRGEKDCKHCRAAREGRTIGSAAAERSTEGAPNSRTEGVQEAGERRSAQTRSSAVVPFVKPVSPMLASTMDSATIANWHEWAVEEKFDGHRAIVMVAAGAVTAWSRSGKSRDLPPHVRAMFAADFPNGVYDGELMGREGGTFADVRRVETQDLAYFVVFDVLNLLGDDVMGRPYAERRELLGRVFEARTHGEHAAVRCAESLDLTCEADVVKFVAAVWARGGEGAILKRRAARYQPGARSRDFVKVKKLGSEVVEVVGFEASKGKVDNRGAFAVVKVRAADGAETTVKTKNAEELRKFNAQWAATRRNASAYRDGDPHPAIGRGLRIEYAYRDEKSGAFVNPRWDRWEDE